jgi:hypothetical protein
MVFLTAAHDKSEVMRMEKAEVDRDRNSWLIPREKTKGKRSLVLPLSAWPWRRGTRRHYEVCLIRCSKGE